MLQAQAQLESVTRAKLDAGETGPLEAWDYAYYARQITASKYKVDGKVSFCLAKCRYHALPTRVPTLTVWSFGRLDLQELRPYLTPSNVLAGIEIVLRRVFGVVMTEEVRECFRSVPRLCCALGYSDVPALSPHFADILAE